MEIDKQFVFYKGYLEFLKKNNPLLFKDVLRNNYDLDSEKNDPALKLLDSVIKLMNKIFQSADEISISLLNYPEKLNKIENYQNDFFKKIMNFSKVSQSLAASAEELHAVITQFSDNINTSVSTMGVINENSKNINKNLEKIDIEISEVTRRTYSIEKVNQETIQQIINFSDVLSEVNSNIGMIKEISDRISFLALNASIEAARAGDQGKGFSVVADGVSSLAEKSKHAVKIISESILKIRDNFQLWKTSSEKSSNSLKDIILSIEKMKTLSVSSETLSQTTSQQVEIVTESFGDFQGIMSEIEKTANYVANSATEIIESINIIEDESKYITENLSGINKGIQSNLKLITNQNPIWLLKFIYTRRIDHIKWVKAVDEAIQLMDIEKIPQLDHTKCKMGLWYYQADIIDDEQRLIHRRLEEPHRMLHGAAKKIKEAISRKDSVLIDKYRKELQIHFLEISTLFNDYIDYLEKKSIKEVNYI
jgi:methyl-accepting chemotaxis protein